MQTTPITYYQRTPTRLTLTTKSRKTWRNKKYKGTFVGNYTRTKKGQRILELTRQSDGATKEFESWQQAIALGWTRA